MTLLVRDEEDILEQNILFHLKHGVDFIIAMDNRSVDSTREILRKYESRGVLEYIFQPQDDYSQDLWTTQMTQQAIDRHGADWIINNDADEFWWPNTASTIKECLAGLGKNVDGVSVERYNFVATRQAIEDCGRPFYKRMRYRENQSFNAHGDLLPGKVLVRGRPHIRMHQGNHSFEFSNGRKPCVLPTRELSILHFPLRSKQQFLRKIDVGGAAYARNTRLSASIGSTWRHLYSLKAKGTLEEWIEQASVSEEKLANLLLSGEVSEDTRLIEFFEGLKADGT